MHAAAPNPLPPPRPSRWRAAAAVAAAVVVAHALLLQPSPWAPGVGEHARPSRPLQVRRIVMPATLPPDSATNVAPRSVKRADAPLGSAAAAATGPAAARAAEPGPPPAADAPAENVTASVDAPQTGGSPPPTYATRLPPAVTLQFAVGSGASAGRATLQWRPADGRYRLTLERSRPGQPMQGAISEGELGPAGVTPVRYTESRRGRDLRAANFRHDTGRITFSGPSTQVPLLPGTQDRLSWMLQLPAVLEAGPALREPGSEVLMFVAGTRGDGELWTFSVLGRETIDTEAGPVPDALHLRRLPSRPYDPQVDAWLDPARHHLPVRLRFQAPGSGTEFTLRQQTPP